jgi:hypothetical protein
MLLEFQVHKQRPTGVVEINVYRDGSEFVGLLLGLWEILATLSFSRWR